VEAPVELLPAHRFDQERLHGYLRKRMDGIGDDFQVSRF
jgi:hypothetical protein